MNKITNIIGLNSTKQSICAFVLLLSLILTSSLSMKTVYVSADDNTPGEITVTFKKDGAGGGDTVVKIKSGECVDLKFPAKGLSKTVEENYEDVVYDQVGWSTAKNQQTSNVTPGTVFTKDTDVWPVWESSETAVPKPVFFAPNGGKGEIENIKVIGKIGNQMPVKIPEKEGFEFKGWSKSPDSQAADVNKNTYVSSYMVCYAVWEKKSSGLEEQIEALQKQVEALKKEIKEYEDKLAKITEKYSSLVTAMETLKEKFEQAIIETVPAQYLYQMDDTAYFMNTETYDQYEIPVANVQEELKFILENSEVKIQFYGTEVIGVQVPTTVELTVTETQPSIKGATVTGSGKPATLETGLVVNVPDFIEAGQKLVINTAEGTYVSRA